MKSAEAREWAELLLPMVMGVAIAGTGGWSPERWAWGLTVMGYGPALKIQGQASYQKGFWTLNPALREPPGSEQNS